MLEEIYLKATKKSQEENQVVGESNKVTGSYYITLQQLEAILSEFIA